MKDNLISYLLEALPLVDYHTASEEMKIAKGKYELPATLKGGWDKLKQKRW
jgi:hypothetical protein